MVLSIWPPHDRQHSNTDAPTRCTYMWWISCNHHLQNSIHCKKDTIQLPKTYENIQCPPSADTAANFYTASHTPMACPMLQCITPGLLNKDFTKPLKRWVKDNYWRELGWLDAITLNPLIVLVHLANLKQTSVDQWIHEADIELNFFF